MDSIFLLAMNDSALYYENVIGTAKDNQMAFELYNRAADAGYVDTGCNGATWKLHENGSSITCLFSLRKFRRNTRLNKHAIRLVIYFIMAMIPQKPHKGSFVVF